MSTTTPMTLDTQLPHDKQLAEARAERKAMFTWVGIILFLLVGSVGMWIYAAYLAISDPTMAVVPDYHEKALQWDRHLENVRQAESLGWTVAVVVGKADAASGERTLTLFLRDREAKPIEHGKGTLRLYHHTRGKDVQNIQLEEKEPGTYESKARLDRNGTWQFDLVLDVGNDHFEWSQPQDVILP